MWKQSIKLGTLKIVALKVYLRAFYGFNNSVERGDGRDC